MSTIASIFVDVHMEASIGWFLGNCGVWGLLLLVLCSELLLVLNTDCLS